jgi:MoaA/NifB/PqqE/SkfB family radical SAM enzyme
MSQVERLFCSRPFKWFEVQRNELGDVYLCCPSWLETSVGNLRRQSVEEIWNGEKAQDIRRSILDGSFRYCNRSTCPFLQAVAEPVQRVEEVADDDLKLVIAGGLVRLPYGPREINCCHDRSCNLSCPSCRTSIIMERDMKQEILEIQGKIKTEALKDAQCLYLTGSGDPFASPFFREWLQTMRREDLPNLQRIHLHTNALMWTPRMWATLDHDVQRLITSAEISVDAATPATYAVNRRPGNFDKLLENLAFIRTLRKQGPLRWVGLSMVVQENNFVEMPEFVRLGRRYHVDRVSFGRLTNWGTYSDEEFHRRAIHFPTHPRHEEFLESLHAEILSDPDVFLGNLAELRQQEVGQAS